MNNNSTSLWDVFISYASEDQEEIAEPLAKSLKNKGIQAFYDKTSIKVGDSIVESIDKGIKGSDYGVIIVTQNYLRKKQWSKQEFEMLVDELVYQDKKIFSIWYKVTRAEVRAYHIILAKIAAINWERGVDEVSNELIFRMKEGFSNG